MSDPEETIDRRKFLTKSAALLAGGAALARTALSYDKILGANDRCLSLCQHIAHRLFKEVRRGRGAVSIACGTGFCGVEFTNCVIEVRIKS